MATEDAMRLMADMEPGDMPPEAVTTSETVQETVPWSIAYVWMLVKQL